MIRLEYIKGSSSKAYILHLRPDSADSSSGWSVTVEYGRIGKPLRNAVKAESVPHDQANKAFDKLLREKLNKDYSVVESRSAAEPAESAPPAAGAFTERVDVPVMLLNGIDDAQGERLVGDAGWCAELKLDGERRLIVIDNGDAFGVNRRGLKVPLDPRVRAAALAAPLRGRTVLDGEDLGAEGVVIFDVLMFEGQDTTHLPYRDRLDYRLCARARLPGLRYATTALSAVEKATLLLNARDTLQEGVVWKRLDAPHAAGRPNSGGPALKQKFTESASFRVARHNMMKRSVELEVIDTSTGQWIAVGNVTIPANHVLPATGQPVECKYLYAYRGGSIYQPVYRGPRPDLEPADCTLAQLKFVDDRVALPAAA